jgi:hypothetical protein
MFTGTFFYNFQKKDFTSKYGYISPKEWHSGTNFLYFHPTFFSVRPLEKQKADTQMWTEPVKLDNRPKAP